MKTNIVFPFEQSLNFINGTNEKTGYVLHATLGRFIGAKQTLTDQNSKNPVSCHFLISEKQGECIELVRTQDIAWHAGKVSNPTTIGKTALQYNPDGTVINPNRYMLGIEFCCGWDINKNGKVDVSELDLTDNQIELCALYMIRNYLEYNIPYSLQVGHTDLADYKADNMYRHKERIIKKIEQLLPKYQPKTEVCVPIETVDTIKSQVAKKEVLGLFATIKKLFMSF
jgi:hypothetical protein